MLHISKLVSGLMLVELVISLLIRQLLIENKLAKISSDDTDSKKP